MQNDPQKKKSRRPTTRREPARKRRTFPKFAGATGGADLHHLIPYHALKLRPAADKHQKN